MSMILFTFYPLLPKEYCTIFSCLHDQIFFFPRAAPVAYGGSQARSLIRAEAAGLHQSHSNARATATPDPSRIPTSQLIGNAGSLIH